MFYKSLFVVANESASTSAANTAAPSGAGAATTPTAPLSADDIFAQAANELSEDAPDDATSDDDTENKEKTDGTEGQVDPDNPDPAGLNQAEELPLYHFKGKIGGKEVTLDIKDQKDLDKVIAQGLAAKTIVPEYKRIKEENAQLKVKAQRAETLDKMIAEKPAEFLALIEDNISEDALADWVHDKFHYFKKLAEMNDDERKVARTNKAAEKILREREEQAREREEAARRTKQESIDLDFKRLKTWREDINSKYKSKIDPYWHSWLDEQVKTVMLNYKGTLKDGESVNIATLTKLLETTIAPVLSAVPKKTVDKTVAQAINNKSNTATRELQNLARKQSTSGPAKPTAPMTSDDIWNQLSNAAGEGRFKLQS